MCVDISSSLFFVSGLYSRTLAYLRPHPNLSVAHSINCFIQTVNYVKYDEKNDQIRNSKFKAHQSLGLARQGHQASPHPCPWLSKTQTRSAKELRRSHRSSSVCSQTLQRMFCWSFLDFLYFYFNRLVGPDRKIQSKIQSTCSSRNKV